MILWDEIQRLAREVDWVVFGYRGSVVIMSPTIQAGRDGWSAGRG